MAFRVAVAAAAAALAAASPPSLLRLGAAVRAEEAARRLAAVGGAAAAPPAQFFNQTTDHFAPSPASWQQRFWVNASFWRGAASGAPVFLYLEGEGAGSAGSVVGGQHVELAAVHGALLVSLEHRFYGASLPTGDLSLASLRVLSSDQALGDVARFITGWLAPAYGLDLAANRIVTFGGSYPGALSAWARAKLPHLIAFAFSTSSPVEASYDFTGYCDVVSDSLSDAAVGGSPTCRARVAAAFADIDTALRGTPAQAAAMAARVHSCAPPTNLDDTKLLASNLAGVLMSVVQYNEEISWASIANFCAAIEAPGADPVDVFAQLLLQTTGGACMDNSYADFLAQQVGNTTADPNAGGVGVRAWTYQTCVQFSYFQTCEAGTDCPFSTLMDLASQVKLCQDAFAPYMDAAFVSDRVSFTNAHLGGYRVAGPPSDSSNILFINGGVDPWHFLSNRPDNMAGQSNYALLAPTGAHCRTMSSSRPSDPADITAVKAEAAAILATFLDGGRRA